MVATMTPRGHSIYGGILGIDGLRNGIKALLIFKGQVPGTRGAAIQGTIHYGKELPQVLDEFQTFHWIYLRLKFNMLKNIFSTVINVSQIFQNAAIL